MEKDALPTAYRQTFCYKVSRLRMPFTYVMAALGILLMTNRPFLPGLVLIAVGIFVRIWAAGHIVKRHKITRSGPYAYTRNPLYVGSFLWGLGTFLLVHNWWLVLAFLWGFAFFYGCTMLSEEDYLSERHGVEFVEYRASVPVFFPRLVPADSVHEAAFSWRDVLRNDEHKALASSIAVVLAILVRAYL